MFASCRAHAGSVVGAGPEPDKESVPEGVAANAMGNVYGAETSANDLKKFVKK